MNATEPREDGLFQSGDGPQDICLRAIFHLRLKPDHIIKRAERIILAQLHNRMGFDRGVMRVGQAHRFHRPPTQSLRTAFGHDFDGQAAFEIGRVFLEVLKFGFVGLDQGLDESVILILIQRAVDVIRTVATRSFFVITGLHPRLIKIDRVFVNDWSYRIEKGETVFARLVQNCICERGRGEGTRCDNRIAPLFGRQAFDLAIFNRDQRVRVKDGCDRLRKGIAINRQRAARRQFGHVAHAHNQRAGEAHFFMQHANGIARFII